MDIGSSYIMHVSEDSNSVGEFSKGQQHFTHTVSEDLCVTELEKDITKFLKIQDKKLVFVSAQPSTKFDISNVELEDIPSEFCPSSVASEKFLKKCTTFPCSSKNSSSAAPEKGKGDEDRDSDLTAEELEQNGGAKSVAPPCTRSTSLPAPRKLVSAMKGSREKEGTPTKKLTLTWAPDVYDPLPMAVSHVASKSARYRGNNKKNGKNKQKGGGKSSRGSKGKDKKQTRKLTGSSTVCLKSSVDDNEKLVDTSEYRPDLENFDVGRPDPFCGHSFLKKSVTKLHFPVAEAT